jgi:poly(3-hydroxybutyrate) depolymerase
MLAAAVGCGGDADTPAGVRMETITVESEAVGRSLPVTVARPAGAGKRPLLVFLHGRNNDDRTYVGDPMLTALDGLGGRAPIVAFPRSSEASYWHDRDEGAWARYVTDEVIPTVVRRFDADGRRVAIGGISMGGFGALDLARLNRDRFCAAGGHSAAIWPSAGETAAGAFDDAEDFSRHDVIAAAQAGEFGDLPLWLDAGDEDPFIPGQTAFAAAAGVELRVSPGGHDGEYWDSHWDDYLRFYARELARC